jgi:hypothetical protein
MVLQSGLIRRRLMPIWLHQTITLFLIGFGWLGVPALGN